MSLILALFCVFLPSCAQSTPKIDYRQSSFRAHTHLVCDRSTLTAEISYDANTATLRIDILSPSGLSGVSLYRENGKRSVKSGNIDFGDGLDNLLAWLDLILPDGELIATGKQVFEGRNVISTVIEASGCEILLDADTYAPLTIRQGERQIKLNSFEFIP